jgi:aldehyde dehydrogenase (NAD+)
MASRYALFIDGAWCEPASGEWLPNVNPADTGDIIGEFAMAGADDMRSAIDAAKRAHPAWRGMPAPRRGELLYRAANIMEARIEEIATALTREMGKPLHEARLEVARGPFILRYYAGECAQPSGEVYPTSAEQRFLFTRREPLGVVGIITPWNFPFAIPMWKSVPALAFGNCVVMKAAALTPLTAWHIADVFREAGLPPGVFNLVTGAGRKAGQAMVEHPDVIAISFTGSDSVGRAIQQQAIERGAKVQLELGGKNPIVVASDAIFDLAVDLVVRGSMRSAGQKCTATSRVFVEKPIYERFCSALAERVRGLRVGDGMDASTYVGPVVSEDQRESIYSYIEIGKQEGARVAAGGERLTSGPYERGYYVQPTVFVDAAPHSRVMQEEIFGPVVGVAPVNDLDEGIAAANDVRYGLSASIISIQAGMVHVNDETAGAEPQISFGGVKASSSHSREQGKSAREFYTQVKTVYMDYPPAPPQG